MIDRFGKCPNPQCGCEWDDGDILASLRKLGTLQALSEEELVNLAYRAFGYNKLNPKHFSKVVAVKVIDSRISPDPVKAAEPDFYMCPQCKEVWDADTGQHYSSLPQAKREKYEPFDLQIFDHPEE